MLPEILVRGARVAAGRFPGLGSRLVARFSPQRTPENRLVMQRSLHATVSRALPLIPIVVEQTVQWPGGDTAWGWEGSGLRARRALDPQPHLAPAGSRGARL